MKRTGNSKIAVVGWGRGMGHKGHMYLADAVIITAQSLKADPYFFVSKTVGKDDPLMPEEKIKIYQSVFPQQAPIFTAQGNLNQSLEQLAQLNYDGVVLVVGADQKEAFKYLERPNKEGVPVYQSFGLKKLRVISRQQTKSKYAKEEGPRATPMREILMHPNASEEQKYQVWRRDMPEALSDQEVLDLMRKAEQRLMTSNQSKRKKIKEFIERVKPMLSTMTTEQKTKMIGLLESSLEEYGDTAKGQKMLTKVQKRAVDRVTSKKAGTDPKYAKKNSDTANRAWDRMTDKDVAEGSLNEFAPTDDGDDGQEDMFFKYAKLWYNGNEEVQQRIIDILDKAGWEIGELESEEGGAFIVQSGDENGDTYMGWSAEELQGLDETKDKIVRARKESIEDPKNEDYLDE